METKTTTLAERLAKAYKQAVQDHKYTVATRMVNCPSTGNDEDYRKWRETYPYQTEESFTLPALEAVLEAERSVVPDYVYVIRNGDGDVESIHRSEETVEAETNRLNEEYVAEALSRGYRLFGPYWWAETEVQA